MHLEARGGFVAMVVQDTGAGIPPEERAAIFEAYRQAGDVRSRRGGTGLGLSIAQRLVGMHGGTIELRARWGAARPSPSACRARRAPRSS